MLKDRFKRVIQSSTFFAATPQSQKTKCLTTRGTKPRPGSSRAGTLDQKSAASVRGTKKAQTPRIVGKSSDTRAPSSNRMAAQMTSTPKIPRPSCGAPLVKRTKPVKKPGVAKKAEKIFDNSFKSKFIIGKRP